MGHRGETKTSLSSSYAPAMAAAHLHLSLGFLSFFFFNFNWRLITLQYGSGFCHTLTRISHGCTCVPHPEHPLPPPSPSSLDFYRISNSLTHTVEPGTGSLYLLYQLCCGPQKSHMENSPSAYCEKGVPIHPNSPRLLISPSASFLLFFTQPSNISPSPR